MAPSEQLPNVVMEEDDYSETEGSDSEDSNDSQDDPTYDIFEETQSGFSNLSMEKKSKSRIQKETDMGFLEDLDEVEIVAPVLDEKDEKSFEMVQKMIEAGQLEKLKVDQCKVYLRKNGLRLTGNKETLIQRIKEHLDIINGGGEKKYPVSSFVLNCTGDACTGDVVMFEQNVYEMFNIASRSASGPPCGSRIIAGRIVKDSYGAAKQQHTFTIEVLWSKGEKPLPPLHPLLIKGRNLYRLKTLRQRWEDEGERQKVLMDKHSRGSLARSDREARIQEKEMRKNNRLLKVTRKAELKKNESLSNPTKPGLSVDSGKLVQPPTQQKQSSYQVQQYPPLQRENLCPNTCKENIGVPQNMLKFPQEIQHSKHDGCFANNHSHREPLRSMNHFPPVIPSQRGYPPMTPSWGYPPMPPSWGYPPLSSSWGHSDNKQVCRHYAKGRCYFGDNCKFLHDLR
ncbi:zinc finger CCCH domain-containing protein 62-like [Vitis riparia]|uniref:zinc finger CCCH domain-containing protein 62-like n=1 Tax=Vitis riparia TaxID=96939 RepID=UPI00155A1C3B|nr:zinc finger CCCH domain-containing protein 62-like [Vitis riparia]